MHLAVKEIVLARKENQMDKETYTKMLQTACSKLCALPICIMTWFLSYKSSSLNLDGYVTEFTAISKKAELHNSDMPHKEERMALMQSILSKMEEQVGIKNRQIMIEANNKLVVHKGVASPDHTESLLATWTHVNNLGHLDMDSVWILQDLFKICGAKWLVGVLIKDLLSLVYLDEIQKKTEMLIAVLHVELEECTLALLLHVVPKYLQYKENQSCLTDPHGTAVAKVLVSCIYSILIPHQLSLKSGLKSSSSSGSSVPPVLTGTKRSLTEADFLTEFPQAKVRKVADGEKSSSNRGGNDRHSKRTSSSIWVIFSFFSFKQVSQIRPAVTVWTVCTFTPCPWRLQSSCTFCT